MACLIGCLAFFTPRLALVVVYFFSDLLQNAYQGKLLLPLLGFLFMPVTTLVYAWLVRDSGTIEGPAYVFMTLSVLFDLGLIGGGAKSRRRKEEG